MVTKPVRKTAAGPVPRADVVRELRIDEAPVAPANKERVFKQARVSRDDAVRVVPISPADRWGVTHQ